MSMSKNWMKINLKDALQGRTSVRPDTYEMMANCMDMTLRGFCASIVQEFEVSGDQCINEDHVALAFLRERFKDGPCEECEEEE